MDNILEVKQLSKVYRKSARPKHRNIREDMVQWFQHLLHSNKQWKAEVITALQEVSFTLKKGEVLGIVGRNGAGKSTLLKILAGIVQPTSGNAVYQGRLVSILELGAGFHPDLTGKENVYLNGALLGMSPPAIRKQFEAIVAFSELDDFINEPVKRYSSGMYLRLAFSIFTHLTTDILLLDEVMSVGDIQFQRKSYQQVSRLAHAGTSIIMVSHSPDQLKELCHQCLWLHQGKVMAFGPIGSVLDSYLEKSLILESQHRADSSSLMDNYSLIWPEGLGIRQELKVLRYGLKARHKKKEEPILITDDLEIEIEFEKLNNHHSIEITIAILSLYGAWVLVDSYGMYPEFDGKVTRKGRYQCKCVLPAGVINFGIYQLGLLVSKSEELIYQDPGLIHFKVQFMEKEGVKNNLAKTVASIIRPMGKWEIYHA